jgi:hypothetical protein
MSKLNKFFSQTIGFTVYRKSSKKAQFDGVIDCPANSISVILLMVNGVGSNHFHMGERKGHFLKR